MIFAAGDHEAEIYETQGMSSKDVQYRADVEAQIELLKNATGNEENKQVCPHTEPQHA